MGARLATFVVAATLGAALGVIGTFAILGEVNPSADHVANQVTESSPDAYGTR